MQLYRYSSSLCHCAVSADGFVNLVFVGLCLPLESRFYSSSSSDIIQQSFIRKTLEFISVPDTAFCQARAFSWENAFDWALFSSKRLLNLRKCSSANSCFIYLLLLWHVNYLSSWSCSNMPFVAVCTYVYSSPISFLEASQVRGLNGADVASPSAWQCPPLLLLYSSWTLECCQRCTLRHHYRSGLINNAYVNDARIYYTKRQYWQVPHMLRYTSFTLTIWNMRLICEQEGECISFSKENWYRTFIKFALA